MKKALYTRAFFLSKIMEDNDKEEWMRAINGVQPLDQKQTISMKNVPVFTGPTKEVLTYDLHGMTVQQAFDHTIKLCARGYECNMSQITIVTGKSGQIRREFEAWLENPSISRYVRGFRPLPNGGSFYVYLRKR
jgi:DNA-nicking Smr family endonuclease